MDDYIYIFIQSMDIPHLVSISLFVVSLKAYNLFFKLFWKRSKKSILYKNFFLHKDFSSIVELRSQRVELINDTKEIFLFIWPLLFLVLILETKQNKKLILETKQTKKINWSMKQHSTVLFETDKSQQT